MVEGRLRKYLQEICAVDQNFVKNPDETVEAFLKSKVVNLLISFVMKLEKVWKNVKKTSLKKLKDK